MTSKKSDAFLGFGEMQSPQCKYFLNLSSRGDLNEAARNFFAMLHELDTTDADMICISPIPNVDIGVAINVKLQQMIGAI